MTEGTDQFQFQTYVAEQAQRQTNALETIRNYVFYLLLLAVLGVIFGVIAALGQAGL